MLDVFFMLNSFHKRTYDQNRNIYKINNFLTLRQFYLERNMMYTVSLGYKSSIFLGYCRSYYPLIKTAQLSATVGRVSSK